MDLNPTTAVTPADEALDRAAQWLLDAQHPDGYWKAELEGNVTIDAEDLFFREFLGIRTAEQTAGTARWIRSRQREDGSWATFYGGPPELSTTIEAYLALRIAGDFPTAGHMSAAARCIRELGGVGASRVHTQAWLAMFGLWSWDDLPPILPELVLAPPWMPFSIYDFACWTRLTFVPFTVVASLRPRRPVGFTLDELRPDQVPDQAPDQASGQAVAPSARIGSWPLRLLDGALRTYGRHPSRALRRRALRRATEWIVRRQEADGSWAGMHTPWVYSLLALHLLGYPLDHPAMRAGVEGLDGYTIQDEKGRRIEAAQSPVMDTAMSVLALRDAGLPADHEALRRSAGFMLDRQARVRGDWSVRRPEAEPGGWPLQFVNGYYPDIDDAFFTVLALRDIDLQDHPQDVARRDAAVERGIAWVTGMRCRDGGWATFEADNTRDVGRHMPYAGSVALHDPPCPDVTAHAVEMLAREGRADSEPARQGVAWLLREQEPDGAWYGRCGANYVYGIGAVVPALVAAGLPATHPAIVRGVGWLVAHQNPDGGWGEDPRSYTDPAWRGRGGSTASQTAWALLALLAAGEHGAGEHGAGAGAGEHGAGEHGNAVGRGVGWLVQNQREDGSWDEPQFTGTGLPGEFYVNYHIFRQVFPVMALGRHLRARERAV